MWQAEEDFIYSHSSSRALTSAALLLAALAISSCGLAAQQTGPGNTASATRLQTPSSAPPCLNAASGPASGVRWQSPSQTATTPPRGAPGTIAGHLTYPSDFIIPQLVYAISTAGPAYGAYSTETTLNQASYTIQGIAPGTYFVYSAVRPLACYTPTGGVVAAAYTDFVKCGLVNGCSAHTLLAVTVRSNATTSGIDVEDWYGDAPTFFPAPPPEIVPSRPPVRISDPPYTSAREAAVAIVMERQMELLQATMTTCPVNRACQSIGEEHDGTQAAYFIGAAGSNADILACGTYVYKDSSGWRGLRWQCAGSVFPAVGQSGAVWLGMGETSCVNVRTSPGSNGVVVGCLNAGTAVRLDDGPVYSPMSSMNGVWWHVAGRGWMADDYIR